jgi:Ca-activated chloride channel family protein
MTNRSIEDSRGTDLPKLPIPAWQKPTLLVVGAGLLTLGAILNLERFSIDPSDELPEAFSWLEETPVSEPRGFELRFSEDEVARHSKAEEVVKDEGELAQGTRHSGSLPPNGGDGRSLSTAPVPQMARSFDPDMSARQAGILGIMEQQSAHFLATPYGGGFAIGNDDADVWGSLTGAEVGEAYGVGGLGLVGMGSHGDLPAPTFGVTSNDTHIDPRSTFSIDVDTASYGIARQWLLGSARLPPRQQIRTEEMLNYFDYDYPEPQGDLPFSVSSEIGPCPWLENRQLLKVGIQGKVIRSGRIPPRNLVFLVDVSGSMGGRGKLDLVKLGLAALTEHLRPNDRIAIVVYAGQSRTVLRSTPGSQRSKILRAIASLEPGGSTNGSSGIHLAYTQAERNHIRGGINRVVLATDGDFNVGVVGHHALIELIEAKRKTGTHLSVLGVGTSHNDHTMEQIADHGDGNYAFLDRASEARKVLIEQADATLMTIAKDVKLQLEFDPERVVSHRLVGYENRTLQHHEFDDDLKDAGEIGSGHAVTALYEIELREASEPVSVADLDLRFKAPNGHRSRKVSYALASDADTALADASTDFRFTAAVAGFAERLRGRSMTSEFDYAEMHDLAAGALGKDPRGERAEFLTMIDAAAKIPAPPPATQPRVVAPPPSPPAETKAEPTHVPVEPAASEPAPKPDRASPEDRGDFIVEVLRVLPPFLALPLFVMAFRRRRRD